MGVNKLTLGFLHPILLCHPLSTEIKNTSPYLVYPVKYHN